MGEDTHHERFGGPRQPGNQTVAANQHRDQQLFNDRFLTDDDAPQCVLDGGYGVVEPGQQDFRVVWKDRRNRFRHRSRSQQLLNGMCGEQGGSHVSTISRAPY